MSFIRIGLDKSPTSKAIVDSQKFYIQSARISNNLIEMFVGATLVDRQKFTGTVNPIVNSGALGAGYYNHAITDIFIGDIHRVCMFNRVLDYESFFAAINYLKNSLGI